MSDHKWVARGLTKNRGLTHGAHTISIPNIFILFRKSIACRCAGIVSSVSLEYQIDLSTCPRPLSLQPTTFQ